MTRNVRTLVLAGQRAGVIDPLCAEFGVEYKVDTPILDKPMILWVSEALKAAGMTTPYLISGRPPLDAGWQGAKSGEGPADSALLALENVDMPCLITTGDHPLLTNAMITYFLDDAQKTGADFCIGLAAEETIQSEYPNTKRTYLRFSNIAVSGCNLFYVANKKGLAALEFWKEAQHLRKQPLKLARKIGIGLGLKYAASKLSLDAAFETAGKKIGIDVQPVLLPFAEAAIDVDKVSDHALVEEILQTRFNSALT